MQKSKRVSICLNDLTIRLLNYNSKKLGMSKSEFVRMIILNTSYDDFNEMIKNRLEE